MRITQLLLSLFLSASLLAQWEGDTDKYDIFPDSLQLNEADSEGGSAYLSKTSDVIEEATWEFHVTMKFNPSSSNYAMIYLVAYQADLSGNAYYVKVGGSNDEVSLFRQDGAIHTLIIDGVDNRVDVSSVDISIRVTRRNGNWELFSDLAQTGYQKEGAVYDNNYLSSSYFGVKSVYTKTRASLFNYSHFSITGLSFTDNVAPHLDSLISLTKYKCRFYFNELIKVKAIKYGAEQSSDIIVDGKVITARFETPFLEYDSTLLIIDVSDTSDNVLLTDAKVYYSPYEVIFAKMETSDNLKFQLNKVANNVNLQNIRLNGENPSLITTENGMYSVTFSVPLEHRTTADLIIKDILDLNGDTLKTYTSEISYFEAEFGDIVFNEIMADPDPIVSDLPGVEYVELYNNSPFDIHLEDWEIIKEDKHYSFPEYLISTGEFLVIGSVSAMAEFPDSIQKLPLSSFPALVNSGMSLQLVCNKGNLIDFVDYDNQWHDDDFKAEGGFSLERIDVNNPSQINNWISSCSLNGGTPGIENCVANENPDIDAPSVVNAYALDNSWIMLNFSEPILRSELLTVDYYTLSGTTIAAVIPLGDLTMTSQVMLGTSAPMADETVYELVVSDIKDMSGNTMETSAHNVAICQLPEPEEIVINELMFAPLSGEAEYIEIYNNTDVPFDLVQLKVSRKDDDGAWETGKSLSDVSALILPRDYMVITDDAETLTDQYVIDEYALISISTIPSLSNETGNIALLLQNATVIDDLNYSEEWHSPLLNDTRGVALERLDADAPTNEQENWFSASSLNNYGTPGAQNSQLSTETTSENDFQVAPEVFTPDGDGTDDFTTIRINEKYEGSTIRIQVFNHRGSVIKKLTNNALIGTYSDIRWDGTDKAGVRCPMGSYLIWIEVIKPNGDVVTEKLECVVSVRVR